jgi:hypothetical protein
MSEDYDDPGRGLGLIIPVFAVIWAEQARAITLGTLTERVWDLSVAAAHGTRIKSLIASLTSSHS